MSYPQWRKQLASLVNQELAKFIPRWLKLEPPDVDPDFFIEIEFFNWWQEVKVYTKRRRELHPSLQKNPALCGAKRLDVYPYIDLEGTGIPRKLAFCYSLPVQASGLDFWIDGPPKIEWPMTLNWPFAKVVLADSEVFIEEKLNPLYPKPGMREPEVYRYNPAEKLCRWIEENPVRFRQSLEFWYQHYQTYLALTPTERQFLAALPEYPSWLDYDKDEIASIDWNPDRFFRNVSRQNRSRYLRKLESLGLIYPHRSSNGNILALRLKPATTGPVGFICKKMLRQENSVSRDF